MGDTSSELNVLVWTRAKFDTEERAAAVVNYLAAHPHFGADQFGEAEPYRRLGAETMEQATSLVVNRAGQQLDPERVFSMVIFNRRRRPRCSYSVGWSRLPHVLFDRCSYRIEQGYLQNPNHLEEWLQFVFGLLGLHEAWYALFGMEEEQHTKNSLTWYAQEPYAADPAKGVGTYRGVGLRLTTGAPGVYWGNYFGPFYADWFGRDRFEGLPCLEKRWLDTGGVFFTTAATPFMWDTGEARQVQGAVKAHLGADAFFDMEVVRQQVAKAQPLARGLEPEDLQPPRRIPSFPFKAEAPRYGPPEQEMEEARRYFESNGFTFVGIEQGVLIFTDGRGGITRVAVGPGGSIEYRPAL